MKTRKLTAERLHECLSYNPETGKFVWIKRISIRITVGREAGLLDSHGHRNITIDGERIGAHRLAWLYVYGCWPAEGIDHINCDKDDNRIANLRDAKQGDNCCNRGKQSRNTSGYKGVSYHKGAGKWLAQIGANKQHHYLGLFETPEAAHAAYASAAQELHGEFARVA